MITDAELEELGLYDPRDPLGEHRLQLLHYLIDLGATAEDLVAYRMELAGLAAVLPLRGQGWLTLGELVAKSGMAEVDVRRVVRAAGFPEPGPDDRVFDQGFIGLCQLVAGGGGLFGEEAVLQIMRVSGSAMARLADALVSSFIANVEPAIDRVDDPAGLEVARANAHAVSMLPELSRALDVLLRQHLVALRRIPDPQTGEGFETRRLCVGFVDLVGSTALARRLSAAEFGRVLTEFENVTTDQVNGAGGRVVKLIGDEALFTAPDAAVGSRIALGLAATFADHPIVPPVRAAIASGEVVLRDGDVFGSMVNLAARAAKVGGPGEVVAPIATAQVAELACEPLGPVSLQGLGDLELCRLLPPD